MKNKRQIVPFASRKWKGLARVVSLIVSLLVAASVAVESGATKPAEARTQPNERTRTTEEPAESAFSSFESSEDVASQIQNFVQDARGFAKQSLEKIQGIIEAAKGAVKIPDLGEIVDKIRTGKLGEESQTATQVENNLPDSYAIKEDVANQAERTGVLDAAQSETLSKEAQQSSQQVRLESDSAAAESAALATLSEGEDTSQNILRNISGQLKQNAAIDNLMLQEASQARQDRALGLTLEAQAAKELSEKNTADRQTTVSESNRAISQGAMLMMPGGSIYDPEDNQGDERGEGQ